MPKNSTSSWSTWARQQQRMHIAPSSDEPHYLQPARIEPQNALGSRCVSRFVVVTAHQCLKPSSGIIKQAWRKSEGQQNGHGGRETANRMGTVGERRVGRRNGAGAWLTILRTELSIELDCLLTFVSSCNPKHHTRREVVEKNPTHISH